MGVIVNRAHEPLLRTVMRLSIVISFLMVAYFIGSIISYAQSEEPVTVNDWISLFIFFALCGISVPVTGYLGAKQKDANKLQMFSLGEGCISCCSFTTIASTFWSVGAVVTFCQSSTCQEQFANGTALCVQYTRQGSRTHISKELCDDPYSYWYLWFVVLFLGPIGLVSGIATCKAVELKNHLYLMVSPRTSHVHGSQSHVATSQATIIRQPVNRNVPALPPHQHQAGGAMVVQPGSIQMVPMVTQPVTVVQPGQGGMSKMNQPVLVPVYKNDAHANY